MKPTLENPFAKDKLPSFDEPPIVGELEEALLGKEEAAEMARLTGRKGARRPKETKKVDLELTEEEKEILRKEREARKERSPEEVRKRFITWAESIDKDEDWVDETFEFQEDGTVIVPGDLDLENLTEVSFPAKITEIHGNLKLWSLTSAEGLKLPDSIGGGLYLNSLTSAQGLKLPDSIGGGLYLQSLTSAEGLKLPKSVTGTVYLNNMNPSDKAKLREQNPRLRIA